MNVLSFIILLPRKMIVVKGEEGIIACNQGYIEDFSEDSYSLCQTLMIFQVNHFLKLKHL